MHQEGREKRLVKFSLITFRNLKIFKFFQDPGASETIEEELGLTGATADDVETEYVRKICEHEIVTGMMGKPAFTTHKKARKLEIG